MVFLLCLSLFVAGLPRIPRRKALVGLMIPALCLDPEILKGLSLVHELPESALQELGKLPLVAEKEIVGMVNDLAVVLDGFNDDFERIVFEDSLDLRFGLFPDLRFAVFEVPNIQGVPGFEDLYITFIYFTFYYIKRDYFRT
jgi:hypothetical protein